MVKILKIITAVGNENLNNNLKKEKDFEILENDIFYQEGILEYLETNNNVDVLILYENLDGEMDVINLIKSIKKFNDEIIIFLILENKSDEIENLLSKENLKNIFVNEEIKISELIEKLKKLKLNSDENLKEEIKVLKEIINKKEEQILKYQNQYKNEKLKKMITIIGKEKSGKSLILNNLKTITDSDFDFNEININNFLEIKKANKETYKFIIVCEMDIEKIKYNREILNKLLFKNLIKPQKTNIIFNKIDKYSVNKKIAKNIFNEFKIIGNIKLNNYPSFLENEKNNYKIENKKLIKEYLKIIQKIKKENF